jgi:hypothetical protein
MPKQRCLPLLLALSLFARGQNLNQATPPPEPLRCELQTPDTPGAGILDPNLSNHLHFILFSSQVGLRVFSEWNAWGFYARTFTLTDSHANQYQVTSRDRTWDKNYPGTVTINSGEALISDVYLCDGSWRVSPKLPLERSRWTITGHYSLKQDTHPIDVPMFKADKVWHGAIDSPPIQLELTKGCVLRLNAEHQPSNMGRP